MEDRRYTEMVPSYDLDSDLLDDFLEKYDNRVWRESVYANVNHSWKHAYSELNQAIHEITDVSVLYIERGHDLTLLRELVKFNRWFGVARFYDDHPTSVAQGSLDLLRRFGYRKGVLDQQYKMFRVSEKEYTDAGREFDEALSKLKDRSLITVRSIHEINITLILKNKYGWTGSISVSTSVVSPLTLKEIQTLAAFNNLEIL